jgi:hypothetical protein
MIFNEEKYNSISNALSNAINSTGSAPYAGNLEDPTYVYIV